MSGAQHTRLPSLRAEALVVQQLARLNAEGDEEEMTQQRADLMLARVAWSRLCEPGDSTAGELLGSLGPELALDLLVRGVNAKKIVDVACAHGAEIPTRHMTEALSRWKPRLSRSDTLRDIERAAHAGLRIVLPGDTTWPTSLDDLALHAPNMLWVRGDPQRLRSPSLGVVGARAATGYGSHVTAEIVDGVCAAGIAIVSGAAYGIDAVAHRTALAAEHTTIAVLAGGADRPYPRAHETLLDRIAQSGAVCSEMIPNAAPTKWRFLQRNRIIAAISRATLVTEAGMRSGSLNTAGHAAQLGRALGAVPGPVNSASSAGCHRLIREYDAMLVTNSKEACELTGVAGDTTLCADGSHEPDMREPDAHEHPTSEREHDGAWERRVRDALPLRGSRDLAEIAKLAGLTVSQTRGVLAELEILGFVRRANDGVGSASAWALAR